MSTTLELSPVQKFHSHLVNCGQCKRSGKQVITLCRVGEILELRAEMAPEESHRPKSFPFVAKMFERVGTPYGEGTVRDRSIKAAHMYSYLDETGTERWKTAAATIIGYEVETEDGERHYVRPYQIKSLRPKRKVVMPTKTEKYTDEAGVTRTQMVGAYKLVNDDDLIIRRG